MRTLHVKRIFNTLSQFTSTCFLLHVDIDGDGKIGRADLEQMLDKITDQPLSEDDKTKIIDQVRYGIGYMG